MAINFFSLEKSEYELKQSFLEFLDMCYRYHLEASEIESCFKLSHAFK